MRPRTNGLITNGLWSKGCIAVTTWSSTDNFVRTCHYVYVEVCIYASKAERLQRRQLITEPLDNGFAYMPVDFIVVCIVCKWNCRWVVEVLKTSITFSTKPSSNNSHIEFVIHQKFAKAWRCRRLMHCFTVGNELQQSSTCTSWNEKPSL